MPTCHRLRPRPTPAWPQPARLLAAVLCLASACAQANAPALEPAGQAAGGAAGVVQALGPDASGDASSRQAPTVVGTAPGAGAGHVFQGKTSFYAAKFSGRSTASGERYSPQALTMAHRALPFGSWVRVTNLHNLRSVVVRVNDRGPFTGRRVADLSKAAAHQLQMLRAGVVMARFELLPGPPDERLDGTVEAEATRARPTGG